MKGNGDRGGSGDFKENESRKNIRFGQYCNKIIENDGESIIKWWKRILIRYMET